MSNLVKCSLCGYEFDADGMACHTSCPMSRGCSILCCPNCGYQVPDQNRQQLTSFIKCFWDSYRQKRAQRNQPDADGTQPLSTLRAGQSAEVTAINSAESSRLAHLSAYGLIPGSMVTLRQHTPAYVLEIDETEIALDTAVAREILVKLDTGRDTDLSSGSHQ